MNENAVENMRYFEWFMSGSENLKDELAFTSVERLAMKRVLWGRPLLAVASGLLSVGTWWHINFNQWQLLGPEDTAQVQAHGFCEDSLRNLHRIRTCILPGNHFKGGSPPLRRKLTASLTAGELVPVFGGECRWLSLELEGKAGAKGRQRRACLAQLEH